MDGLLTAASNWHASKASRDSPSAGQHPLSKWNNRKSHLRPILECTEAAPSPTPALAAGGQHQLMAIYPSICRPLAQDSFNPWGWEVSRLEMFSSIWDGSSMKTLHTFRCPVLALHHAFAGSKSIPQWDPRVRIRLNLGPSPMHAHNVHLVLSLTTGLVSPQFHCCFDEFYETCKCGVSDMGISSMWQCLAGLEHANGDPWIQSDQRLLSCAPISKTDNSTKSQLPTSNISFLPSELHEE